MRRIAARKTRVEKNLPQELAQGFLEDNHSQGSLKSSFKALNLGLYFEEELVAVAQFSTPRTSAMRKKYSAELYRLAFKRDVRIVGGASKLIKTYRENYNPPDFFTYQDTTGEATSVYEHAGMKLVSQAKRKQYLVAPGKTLETGSRKEVLGMPYATRYGPDRILGTKLGEVYREDGTRKGNKELFLGELGWHIEETSGDRVYEWVNPDRTYYTYKITASDSDKYYYGVSHVKKSNASLEDCLDDGYYGSGGKNRQNKFRLWKAKHSDTLIKEIIETHATRIAAFAEEESLIGNLYLTDKKCLNSTAGGIDGGLGLQLQSQKESLQNCSIHGESFHRGSSCMKCVIAKSTKTKICVTHGETLHLGEVCLKCKANKAIALRHCPEHEITKHKGKVCLRCQAEKTFTTKQCELHGETIHRGDQCAICGKSDVSLKECAIHGYGKHIKDSCYRCAAAKRLWEEECPTHGVTAFNGGHCMKCSALAVHELKYCPVHGLVKHRGTKCNSCATKESYATGTCEIHGEVKLHFGKCSRCRSEKSSKLAVCKVHGEAKFTGNQCMKCVAAQSTTLRECIHHGEVKHRGKSCIPCRGLKKRHNSGHFKNPGEPCHYCSGMENN